MTFPIAFTRGTRAALMMMLVLTGLFWLAPALAQEETAEVVFDSGNVAWMLTSTLLVLLMVVPGLALFYGGMVRSKNVLSVIMQVVSYKLTGRRIFRMAPLHHHFELKGWPEPRVIVRFWIITVILVLIGLATLKLR